MKTYTVKHVIEARGPIQAAADFVGRLVSEGLGVTVTDEDGVEIAFDLKVIIDSQAIVHVLRKASDDAV